MKIVDDVSKLIEAEEKRQRETFTLIPSENYASKAVRDAVGSVFLNKYSEGQPFKRYYQGNEFTDKLETLCKRRALAAFGLKENQWDANVQALSGSPANLAVYNALLAPGDRIMAMYLPDGGHLSHGWQIKDKKVTLVSKIWNISFYHVDRNTRVFNYDEIEKLALKLKPKLLISGGTAYPREIDHARMGRIAKSVGAYYLADIAHEAGLVAGGVNSPPFPHADVVTMTTHKTLRGPRGALIFSRKALSPLIDASVFPGLQGGPHEHTIAGIAVSLAEVQTPQFTRYAKNVVKNARILSQIFCDAGYDVVSGGTDKHLVLIDLRGSGISAWVAAWALEYAGIIVNRNTVPYDTGSSYYPSGLRLGTPAVTTRGMDTKGIQVLGKYLFEVLSLVKGISIPEDADTRKKFISGIRKSLSDNPRIIAVGRQVKALAAKYPVPV